jgi:hypothetical protein
LRSRFEAALPNLNEAHLIPIGYMAKHVFVRPDWLHIGRVSGIYSVSRCVSEDFGNWIESWKHNGYWFFNTPDIIRQVAQERTFFLKGTKLFFYEVHELEFDTDDRCWYPFDPEPSWPTNVVLPNAKSLEGYDVVTTSSHGGVECSPLSCNSLATEIETNQHCLLDGFERARRLLEEGQFDNSEPGPFRIIAVYSTEWP